MTVTGWPSVAGNAGWPSQPQALMPGRVQGWPRGTQSAANDAERLLSTAVGWWDAAYYRDGDRFLRNRGVAGELLDMRLGSSLAANSNDPLYLAPEATGYCYVPSVAGCRLSVPDEAALDITGDIDIRIKVALDDWTPSAITRLVSKYSTADARAYEFSLNTTGTLLFNWTPNTDANALLSTSTAAVPVADGAVIWVRVTLDVDNGTTQNVTRFYTSSDDGSTWVQVGDPITKTGTTSIANSADALSIGARGTAAGLSGRIYRAIVKDGIDGTTVLDVDCDVLTSGSATSFTAATGQTVTINRSTAVRKTVAQPARGRGGRALFLLGTDDYFEVQDNWQHQLLNFGQGDSFTVVIAVRRHTTAATAWYITKWSSITTGASTPGWQINGTFSGYPNMTVRVADGVNGVSRAGGVDLGNALALISAVRNTAARSLGIYSNNSLSSGGDGTGNTGNTTPMRIGAYGGGTTNSLDAEFTAAAVFRRALTRDEITTLSNYFSARNY